MTERENFLERWSRKKREAVDDSASSSKPQEPEANRAPDAGLPPAKVEAEKPFDLESLPSLESITAETDIRDFLRPGVPADLKHEALRRAWSADPGIRDFIGLAENSGDFNNPSEMPGFGPIDPGEVARLIAQFVLTPEEKKVARAPEQLTDQGVGQTGAASESNSEAEAMDKSSDAKIGAATDAALQNEEGKSESVPPTPDRSS
jgi:hypothetical protein